MMDQIKQLWATSTWWQKILLVLVLPVLLLVVWVGLRRGETFPQPDTSLETAETSEKAEATRQKKEQQVVNEYKSATRGLEREHMKRRQEIQQIRTSDEMRRALDEELNR